MPINKAGQVTDDENAAASDPNMVGPQATQAIQDRRAGMMTPSWQYDEKTPHTGMAKGDYCD
jgi:hypothetical protein